MALPTIENVTNQMLNESVREQPTVAMKGNVTRPMIIGDLLRAMNDVNFKELVEEYGSMAGIRTADTTPMTTALMKESPRVPNVPSAPTVATTPVQTTQTFTAPEVPTPMTDAKENTANTGIMSNTTQQIA
jgi:hypothetical protein|tara:strand:- start:113 stop:505 length:393 start_codon:yes stop_codon:yes gene_type:complete